MRTGWMLLVPLLALGSAPARATLIQLTWSGAVTTTDLDGVSVGDPTSGLIRDGPDASTPDNFTMSSDALGPDLDGVPVSTFVFDFNDPTLTAFSSDAIPSSLELGDFANRFALLLFFDGEESFAIQSSVTSLSYAAIPEPGAAALLGAGLLALAAASSRTPARRRGCASRSRARRPPRSPGS